MFYLHYAKFYCIFQFNHCVLCYEYNILYINIYGIKIIFSCRYFQQFFFFFLFIVYKFQIVYKYTLYICLSTRQKKNSVQMIYLLFRLCYYTLYTKINCYTEIYPYYFLYIIYYVYKIYKKTIRTNSG